MKKVILLLITLTLTSCITPWSIKAERDGRRVQEMVEVGSDIHKARELLEKEGFKVSEISDLTKTGETLSMVVTLSEPDGLDSFSYAAGHNFAPWRENHKSHVRIRSNMDGVIHTVEVR